MKKLTLCFSALLLTAILLTSCRGNIVLENDGYYDKKTDTTYRYAPLAYEPVAISKKAYVTDKNGNEYYTVTDGVNDIDGTRWLYCKSLGILLYASDEPMPTLEEFFSRRR